MILFKDKVRTLDGEESNIYGKAFWMPTQAIRGVYLIDKHGHLFTFLDNRLAALSHEILDV